MKRGMTYLYKIITCSSKIEEGCSLKEDQEIKQHNKLSASPMESEIVPVGMDSPTEDSTCESVYVPCEVPNIPSQQEFGCSGADCLCKTVGENDMIKNDLDILINNICPTNYYDFCVITCEADYERALQFRAKFCQKFNLKGCMLHDPDITRAGADVFEKYEAMMDRSTKVLFFLTENYKADSMFLRVQNGAVYQQLEYVQKDREKCIPVFPDGNCKSGLAMSGIVGLDLTLPLNFNNCVLATFNDQVRKVRLLKESRCVKIRQELFCKHFHAILNDAKTNAVNINEHVKMQEILALVKNTLSSLPINTLEVPAHPAQEVSNKNINSVTTTTTVNISGTASNIHVGPKVVLNINVGSESSEE